MEICILKFDGTHAAEDALKEVSDAEADRRPWLHEVGVISRPLVGRLTIRASYQDEKEVAYKEGDVAKRAGDIGAYTGYLLGSLVGPFRAALLSLEGSDLAGGAVAEKEKLLFHIDEIKKTLPRGSSALVLIAETPICDEMTQVFASYDPQVVRRDVADKLRQRLQALRDQTLQQLEQREGEPAPATH